MAEQNKQTRVYGIFQSISTDYDRANARISLGMQKNWKQMLVNRLAESLPKGASVLDVCCGTGDIALDTAEKRGDLQVVGLDFSPAMLAVAEGKKNGKENVRFLQGDAMALPFGENTFAAACISFGLRNTADYEQVLREMRRVVEPGGAIYCLDSFVPENPLIKPFYRIYFRYIMPLLGGGKKHRQEYQWLYESTQVFLQPRELEKLYRSVGLKEVGRKKRMFGACVMIWGQK